MAQEYWEKRPDFIDLLIQRRSIRKFTDQQISDNDIEKILLAGHYAPNASNLQSWEFIVVMNRELNKQIAEIVDKTYDHMSEILQDREAKKHIRYSKFYATFFRDAAVVVYCVAKPYMSKTDDYYRMMGADGERFLKTRKDISSGIQSVAAAIENMLLAAWALGIGSVWMTSPAVARDEINSILEIREGDLAALVALGYPSEPPGEAIRKPLEEVVRYYR